MTRVRPIVSRAWPPPTHASCPRRSRRETGDPRLHRARDRNPVSLRGNARAWAGAVPERRYRLVGAETSPTLGLGATSVASPVVSGVVALMLTKPTPDLHPNE